MTARCAVSRGALPKCGFLGQLGSFLAFTASSESLLAELQVRTCQVGLETLHKAYVHELKADTWEELVVICVHLGHTQAEG